MDDLRIGHTMHENQVPRRSDVSLSLASSPHSLVSRPMSENGSCSVLAYSSRYLSEILPGDLQCLPRRGSRSGYRYRGLIMKNDARAKRLGGLRQHARFPVGHDASFLILR
jgi:hypothetical protein